MKNISVGDRVRFHMHMGIRGEGEHREYVGVVERIEHDYLTIHTDEIGPSRIYVYRSQVEVAA